LQKFLKMPDLYSEVLKYERNFPSYFVMSKYTKESFAEEISHNSQLRDDFLQEYVDDIVFNLSIKELRKSYSNTLLNLLYQDCDADQENQIVEEVADVHPHILRRFGVDVTV